MKTLLKAVLVLLFSASIGACDPPKVTDPSAPGFNPDKFSFSDYSSREQKIEAFRKLFPVGTPKEFIDRVLVTAGHAEPLQSSSSPQVWSYLEPKRMGLPNGPMHRVIFDSGNKVDNINFAVTEYLYPGRTTTEQLREQESEKEK